MKVFVSAKQGHGFTLIELSVVIAAIVILFAILLPTSGPKARGLRINCINNLKQIGVASEIWASDHGDRFPFEDPTGEGVPNEFVRHEFIYRRFLLMSNELNTPKILHCPADKKHKMATAFSLAQASGQIPFNDNSYLSYFVGVDAHKAFPQMFLFGDRNLTNGTPIRNGILELSTNSPAGWTDEIHQKQGNVGLADGSVQTFSTSGLREAIKHTGDAVNRLMMP